LKRRLPHIEIIFDPTRRDRFTAMRRRIAALIKKYPHLGHRAIAKRAKAPRSTVWRLMERLRQGRPL
jgi:DNA-binding IclR family transcriptional regulator